MQRKRMSAERVNDMEKKENKRRKRSESNANGWIR